MRTQLASVAGLLSRRERAHFGLLVAAVIVLAVFELSSIGAVLPFLAVAADPSTALQNHLLAAAYQAFGFRSPSGFLTALGLLAIAALVLSNAWMMLVRWAQHRFAFGRSHTIGVRLLKAYVSRPYRFFLLRNSATLGKNVLQEVEQVTQYVLMPAVSILARGVVAIAIVTFLFVFDPLLAALVTLVLGGAYGAVYWAVRRRLARTGDAQRRANQERFLSVNEAFGSIKEMKLRGHEQFFVNRFRSSSYDFARYRASMAIVGHLPRYVLEAVAFGGILLIAVILISKGGGLQSVIPVLGLYALAGYRLMPALQEVFHSFTKLRFGAAALENISRELGKEKPAPDHNSADLTLSRRLQLSNIVFSYPETNTNVLDGISLEIRANTTVGIVGSTGSGKSTLLDLIAGLLKPQSGEILVDGVTLSASNIKAWQRTIGYVPQEIYLSDDTVARNIAFGWEDIDMSRVAKAALLANIHTFVESQLPRGYETRVGERGVRLSGGQRQRIGIARALYNEPSLLVLDEATSALDDETEEAVLAAVASLSGTRTILLIAHRLSTLRDCDAIYTVSGGQVTFVGDYSSMRAVDGEKNLP